MTTTIQVEESTAKRLVEHKKPNAKRRGGFDTFDDVINRALDCECLDEMRAEK